MNIHWGAYLGIGIAVTVTAAVRDGLGIFIAPGTVFMAVGIIKWMLRRTKRDELSESHAEPTAEAVQTRKGSFVKCPFCRAWNYTYARSCHYCSINLRKTTEAKAL
jgi:hypothetical protein